jgi:agmatine deiminase
VVLVPTFNDPNDRKALNTLADLFPDRQVVGVHAVDLVWGLGTLHCLTQQQPAG